MTLKSRKFQFFQAHVWASGMRLTVMFECEYYLVGFVRCQMWTMGSFGYLFLTCADAVFSRLRLLIFIFLQFDASHKILQGWEETWDMAMSWRDDIKFCKVPDALSANESWNSISLVSVTRMSHSFSCYQEFIVLTLIQFYRSYRWVQFEHRSRSMTFSILPIILTFSTRLPPACSLIGITAKPPQTRHTREEKGFFRVLFFTKPRIKFMSFSAPFLVSADNLRVSWAPFFLLLRREMNHNRTHKAKVKFIFIAALGKGMKKIVVSRRPKSSVCGGGEVFVGVEMEKHS